MRKKIDSSQMTAEQLKWRRRKRVALFGGIFLAVGIVSLVCGFGFANGWDTVIAWFGSKYAQYCYFGAAVLLIAFAGFYSYFRVKEVTK